MEQPKRKIERSCRHFKSCKVFEKESCGTACKQFCWDEIHYPTLDSRLTSFQKRLIEAMVRMNHDILDLAKASGLPVYTVQMSTKGGWEPIQEKKVALAKGLRLPEDYFDDKAS